jgi:hypothetical protein
VQSRTEALNKVYGRSWIVNCEFQSLKLENSFLHFTRHSNDVYCKY